jgi:hypothetical protein
MEFMGCIVLFGGFTALVVALVLAQPRRLAPNVCKRCAYPRVGLPDAAPCPECGGTAVTPAHNPVQWENTIVGAIPPTVGMLVQEAVLSIVSDTPPSTFSLGFHAVSAVAASVIAILWVRHRPSVVLALSLSGVASGTALVCLAYVDAFRWHLDAQSGIVVVVSPFIYACGAGYGLLIAAAVLRFARRTLRTRGT